MLLPGYNPILRRKAHGECQNSTQYALIVFLVAGLWVLVFSSLVFGNSLVGLETKGKVHRLLRHPSLGRDGETNAGFCWGYKVHEKIPPYCIGGEVIKVRLK